jgi:hypothetical protein
MLRRLCERAVLYDTDQLRRAASNFLCEANWAVSGMHGDADGRLSGRQLLHYHSTVQASHQSDVDPNAETCVVMVICWLIYGHHLSRMGCFFYSECNCHVKTMPFWLLRFLDRKVY